MIQFHMLLFFLIHLCSLVKIFYSDLGITVFNVVTF
jgi:hypothetical protein